MSPQDLIKSLLDTEGPEYLVALSRLLVRGGYGVGEDLLCVSMIWGQTAIKVEIWNMLTGVFLCSGMYYQSTWSEYDKFFSIFESRDWRIWTMSNSKYVMWGLRFEYMDELEGLGLEVG